jgi:hypothetical protein
VNGTVHALRQQKGVYAVMETVTPAMAKKWLEKMHINRKLSQSKAVDYAIAMDEGKWSENGESIKFMADGTMIDGQHRCQAAVLADKSFRCLVVYGITDDTAFATVDVGKTRSHADIFHIAGYPSANLASGAALLVYQYRNNLIQPSGGASRRHVKGSKKLLEKLGNLPIKSADASKEELLSFAEPVKDRIIAAVRFAENIKAGKLISRGMVAGCYFIFSEKSETDAERFFLDLFEGVGLSGSDPVYWLRERLISNMASPHKLQRGAVLMLVFKAWNKRRGGEKTKTLKLIEGEEFQKAK